MPCIRLYLIFLIFSISLFNLGARNGLFPFPLNSDFINNYRRLYGPVQLTSIMNGNDLSKSPNRRSPVDSKRLKGKSEITSFALKQIHQVLPLLLIYATNSFIYFKRNNNENELINTFKSIIATPFNVKGAFYCRHCISPADKNTFFIILLKYYYSL